jgi:hypothetical protein
MNINSQKELTTIPIKQPQSFLKTSIQPEKYVDSSDSDSDNKGTSTPPKNESLNNKRRVSFTSSLIGNSSTPFTDNKKARTTASPLDSLLFKPLPVKSPGHVVNIAGSSVQKKLTESSQSQPSSVKRKLTSFEEENASSDVKLASIASISKLSVVTKALSPQPKKPQNLPNETFDSANKENKDKKKKALIAAKVITSNTMSSGVVENHAQDINDSKLKDIEIKTEKVVPESHVSIKSKESATTRICERCGKTLSLKTRHPLSACDKVLQAAANKKSN